MAKLKKIVLIALVVAMVALVGLALASCGPNEDDTPDNGNGGSSNGGLSNDGYVLEIETVYTLAKEAGYTGTLEDLIELFKGAQGEDGIDGKTPYIGENGNWWIDEIDTGVKAASKDGIDGVDGKDGIDGADGKTPYITEVYITDITAWCNISFVNDVANPLNYAKKLYLNNVLVTDLVIPNNVTSIGKYAFYDYTGLTSVTIPSSVTAIDDYAFRGCSGLTTITIPNSVTSVGVAAFTGCSGLTSVTIGNGITSIGDYMFPGCTGLTSIVIPDSVTSIGEFAFYNCTALTSVTIPSGVTSIGKGAFYNCTDLASITFNGTEGEWNAITVGDSWDVCMGMGEYVVKCTDVELVVANVAEWILNDTVTFDKNGVVKTTFSIVPADEATLGSVYTYILNIIDEDETSEIARIELKSDATVTMEFDEGGISGTWTESDGLITIKWDTEDSN